MEKLFNIGSFEQKEKFRSSKLSTDQFFIIIYNYV